MADLCVTPSPRPWVYRWRVLLLEICCFPGPVMYVTLQSVSVSQVPTDG
jgi:hypothetical protein